MLSGWQKYYLNRITINPAVRFVKPCVHGTQLTVGDVVGTLARGCSEAELLEDTPQLCHEYVLACMAFAAERENRLRVPVTIQGCQPPEKFPPAPWVAY